MVGVDVAGLQTNGSAPVTARAADLKVVIIMPAYNEAENIAPVVGDAVARGYRCIVVDDGSTDQTGEIARGAGASVVRHRINLGQGIGVVTGLKAALLESSDVIVEMDADGQHDPSEVPLFLEALVEGGHDIVVGSRLLGSNHGDAPLLRRLFLPCFTGLINVLTGYRLTDAMCGFRAFRTTSLRRVANFLDGISEPQYLAAEHFIRLARQGLTATEVPVHLRDRTSGSSTKGTVRYGFGVLKAILRSHER